MITCAIASSSAPRLAPGVAPILAGEDLHAAYGQSEVLSLLMRYCRPGGGGAPNSLGEVVSPLEIRLVDEDEREVAA